MKKISKSKKGFTLVEMVLVVAIICILAVAIVMNIDRYLESAEKATGELKSHSAEVESLVDYIEDNDGV